MKEFTSLFEAASWYENAKMSPYTEIKAETEKAVLLAVSTHKWFPKSQIQLRKIDGLDMVIMPTWLFWKKATGYTFRNSHGQLVVADCSDHMDKLLN